MENRFPVRTGTSTSTSTSQQYYHAHGAAPSISNSTASSDNGSSTSLSSGTSPTADEDSYTQHHPRATMRRPPYFITTTGASRNSSVSTTRSIGSGFTSSRGSLRGNDIEGNVFDDHNVAEEEYFTTPSNSRPPSFGSSFMGPADGFGGGGGGGGRGSGSGGGMGMGMGMGGMGIGMGTNSARYSLPQAPPMAVMDGGRPGYARHAPSFSTSRSEISELSELAPSLNRSNTGGTSRTTTSNSSHLYSIPSRLSQISSPPSPLPPIEPVRPRMDYGGNQHQSTFSIGSGNSDVQDPFDDSYTEPDMDMGMGNGFAPHRQGTFVPQMDNSRPESARTADTGMTTSMPPPYCQYPNTVFPKHEDRHIAGSAVTSGTAVGFGNGELINRSYVAGHYAPRAAPSTLQGDAESIDASGALKEYKEKKGFSGRWWLWIIAGVLIGLAIGLGAGLGIGLHHKPSGSDAAKWVNQPVTLNNLADDHVTEKLSQHQAMSRLLSKPRSRNSRMGMRSQNSPLVPSFYLLCRKTLTIHPANWIPSPVQHQNSSKPVLVLVSGLATFPPINRCSGISCLYRQIFPELKSPCSNQTPSH